MSLLDWPNSNTRLDAAIAIDADIDPSRYGNIQGLPLVISFSVADLGHIHRSTIPQYDWIFAYDWSRDCSGTHERYVGTGQAQFIEDYYKGFFTHPDIDSAELYKRFMHQFSKDYPGVPIGSYLSSTTCSKDRAFPYVEHYYPESSLGYSEFVTGQPTDMGTTSFLPQCPSKVGRWLLNVADQPLMDAFRKRAVKVVKEANPRPEFVFLDNGVYVQPEFLWATGQKALDCRDVGSTGSSECDEYLTALGFEFGTLLYQQQFIDHYAALVRDLEQAQVRSILNVAVPPAVLGYVPERPKYAKRLSDAVGTNGIAFEQPFHIGGRSNATVTKDELDVHSALLGGHKLVLWFANYADIAESTWIATLAMIAREKGQSIFVARDLALPAFRWADWPARYGIAVGAASFQQVGLRRADVGDCWRAERGFTNGRLTACHLGIRTGQTYDLSTLVPALAAGSFSLVDPPRLGIWDSIARSYLGGAAAGVDYFTLGSGPDGAGNWKEMVTVSAQSWP